MECNNELERRGSLICRKQGRSKRKQGKFNLFANFCYFEKNFDASDVILIHVFVFVVNFTFSNKLHVKWLRLPPAIHFVQVDYIA